MSPCLEMYQYFVFLHCCLVCELILKQGLTLIVFCSSIIVEIRRQWQEKCVFKSRLVQSMIKPQNQ